MSPRTIVTILSFLLLWLKTPGFLGAQDLFEESRKLVATDAAAADNFGQAVAFSGETAVCASPLDDDAFQDSGSAYIFERSEGGSGNWGQAKKLVASGAAVSDQFGFSVTIDSDTVAVSAPDHDGAGANSGVVYIFGRDQGGLGNWGQVQLLTASDATSGDLFGFSLSISGDLLAIAAPYDDDRGMNAGAVFIFEREQGGDNTWLEVNKLTASDAAISDQFGIAVAISGTTVAVGAFADSHVATGAGSAYVFERDHGGPGAWGEVKKLVASDPEAGDLFGRGISIDGSTVVVGALGDDDAGSASGSAYIFQRDEGGTNNWGQLKKLVASDAQAGDQFGRAVAIGGGFLAVSSLRDDDACPMDPDCDSGAVYIFGRNEGGANMWGEAAKRIASDHAALDLFGLAIAMSSDTLLVGATGNSDAGSASGSAYVLRSQGLPSLSIASNVPTPSGIPVSVPIVFSGNGSEISAVAFSVDFDETCLEFDPADLDGNGIPDAISFSVPAGMTSSAVFSAADTEGEVDIVIADFSSPLSTLIDGTVAAVTLTPTCAPGETSRLVPVRFGASPSTSFGTASGESTPGEITDGSVEILPGTPGDCNDDSFVDAGDISACVLEVFDGDGAAWIDASGGSFLGSPVGCDANQDFVIDAGDLSCKILLIFNGPNACSSLPGQRAAGTPELRLGSEVSAGSGEPVALPLTFLGEGEFVSAGTFSVEFDTGCLEFDPATGIEWSLPPGMAPSIGYVLDDTAAKINLSFLDPLLPMEWLPNGQMALLSFTSLCEPGAPDSEVRLVMPSLGDSLGRSTAVSAVDGRIVFADPVFSDGFESGSTDRWSATRP